MNLDLFTDQTKTKILEEEILLRRKSFDSGDIVGEEVGPGGQGAAIEVIAIILGFIGTTIASGLIREFSKDLYSKIKTFLKQEKPAIEHLTFNNYYFVYCYAFVYEIGNSKIVFAFDVESSNQLYKIIENCDDLITDCLIQILENINLNKNQIVELDISFGYYAFHGKRAKSVEVEHEVHYVRNGKKSIENEKIGVYVSYKICKNDSKHWINQTTSISK
ncbi:MAG: hypothetical protein DWQ06_01685 [Calditrichaeota bacterium]|nr:MAG: hypothetical protein DWQ06_01685 [Calditrichota bacterium]